MLSRLTYENVYMIVNIILYNYVDMKNLKRNKDLKFLFWLLYKPSYVYIHDYNGLSNLCAMHGTKCPLLMAFFSLSFPLGLS